MSGRASAYHWEDFHRLLWMHGYHLVAEGCMIEHEEGWHKAVQWLDEQQERYERAPLESSIESYVTTLSSYTVKNARKYCALQKEDILALMNSDFPSQRKVAIEYYATQKTLAFYLTVPPQEYEEELPLRYLQEIRFSQWKLQKIAQPQIKELKEVLHTIGHIKQRDSLLKRRVIGSKWWMA